MNAPAPPLPSGTVTFLFTDIEGSTERWEHHRDAMTVALERHDALLRGAIEASRGQAGRRFAWRKSDDPTRGNVYETRIKRTTPVGVFVEGDSPEGASDLSGNVFEWASSAWGTKDELPDYVYPYDATDGREDAGLPPGCQRVLPPFRRTDLWRLRSLGLWTGHWRSAPAARGALRKLKRWLPRPGPIESRVNRP